MHVILASMVEIKDVSRILVRKPQQKVSLGRPRYECGDYVEYKIIQC